MNKKAKALNHQLFFSKFRNKAFAFHFCFNRTLLHAIKKNLINTKASAISIEFTILSDTDIKLKVLSMTDAD